MSAVVRVYLYPDDVVGAKKHILLAGLMNCRGVSRCLRVDDADVVIVDAQRDAHAVTVMPPPADKTVVVDYRDSVTALLPLACRKYFKRSVVDRVSGKQVNYPRPVIPIGYTVRKEYIERPLSKTLIRDIDVAVFFSSRARGSRGKVAAHVWSTQRHRNRKVHVGIVGHAGEVGRNVVGEEYMQMLRRSKIVVTCNPDGWEGDYRLFEALASGALVLTDRMVLPYDKPMVDGQHLVMYSLAALNEIDQAIDYYLADPDMRKRIASAGREFVIAHHKPEDRIRDIVRKCNHTLPE